MDFGNGKKNHDFMQKNLEKKINANLNKNYDSKAIEEMDQNFLEYLKHQDFDKKEFKYCKKMLTIKSKEDFSKLKSPRNFLDLKNKVFLNEKLGTEKTVFIGL